MNFDPTWLTDKYTIPKTSIHLLKEHVIYQLYIDIGKVLGASVGEEGKIAHVLSIIRHMVPQHFGINDSKRLKIRKLISKIQCKKMSTKARESYF